MTQTQALVGPRSNLVTDELTIPTPPGPALPGLDVRVARVESLPPGHERLVAGGGAVRHWMEQLHGSSQVRLATDRDEPVLVGTGGMSYLGGWPDPALWDRIISLMAKDAGLDLTELPEGLRLRDTSSHRFAFNYGPCSIAFDGRTIAPAGVEWWPRQTIARA